MPRLQGKRPNIAIGSGVAIVLLVAIAILLEFFGVIDWVPNFGRENRSTSEEIHLGS